MTQGSVFKSMMVMIMVSMFDMTISMIKLLVVKVKRSAVRHSDDFCVCRQGSAVKSTPDQNHVFRQKRLWAIRFPDMRVRDGRPAPHCGEGEVPWPPLPHRFLAKPLPAP